MIEIEVLDSDDYFSLGKMTFHKNLIYIGKDSDLAINEHNFLEKHLMLEVLSDMILVHLHNDVDSFYVNGKITKKIKPIKIGDIIQIGQTKIKLLNAVYSPEPSMEEIKNKNLNKVLDPKHPLHKTFVSLAKRIN